MNETQHPFEIRKGVPADFEAVYGLIEEFAQFTNNTDKIQNSPKQMQEDKDFFRCLVVMDGDRMVGFASYFVAYYTWTGKTMYLDDLFVKEAYRGKGIGNALMDTMLELAREENCKKLRWQVSSWNKNAITFYKRRGASIDDVEMNCDLKV